MSYDELELDRMGDRRTATFFCISDTDSTYNFLVALAFSQMFNLLCERADNVHGGRLPHHVRVLWDEAANTGQVPQLEKLVAVIRSREVSLCLLYQQLAQCKAIYDKNAETILGNMDSVLFLGLRTDVPDLMQAMDAFVLPSRFEGLGIVYIEAQAAGLKTFATAEVVPQEACVDESLFTYLPREATAQQWADAMLAADTTQRENKLEVIQSHGYDIHQEAEKLRALYLKGKAEGEK